MKALKISLAVIVVAVISYCVWKWIIPHDPPLPSEHQLAERIEMYVQGVELNLDVLNSYKARYPKPEAKSDFIWYNLLTWFRNNNVTINTTALKKYEQLMSQIDDAIEIRELINSGDFKELCNQHFSQQQSKFKESVEKIAPAEYEDVKQQLGDVSALTLNQIADSISVVLTRTGQEQQQESELTTGPTNPTAENKPEPPPVPQNTAPETSQQTKTSEIIQYLRGSELNERRLRQYLTDTNNDTLKASIRLCLDFWKLDGSGGNNPKTYWTFRNKIDKDTYLKNSKLKTFLDEMCQKGARHSYSKQHKSNGLK
jgi:hypothetical protein